MIIWALDDYYVYAIAIFVTSAFAAVTNVVQLRGNMVKLVIRIFIEFSLRKIFFFNIFILLFIIFVL